MPAISSDAPRSGERWRRAAAPATKASGQGREWQNVSHVPHRAAGNRRMHDELDRDQRGDHQEERAQAVRPPRAAEEQPPQDDRNRAPHAGEDRQQRDWTLEDRGLASERGTTYRASISAIAQRDAGPQPERSWQSCVSGFVVVLMSFIALAVAVTAGRYRDIRLRGLSLSDRDMSPSSVERLTRLCA